MLLVVYCLSVVCWFVFGMVCLLGRLVARLIAWPVGVLAVVVLQHVAQRFVCCVLCAVCLVSRVVRRVLFRVWCLVVVVGGCRCVMLFVVFSLRVWPRVVVGVSW